MVVLTDYFVDGFSIPSFSQHFYLAFSFLQGNQYLIKQLLIKNRFAYRNAIGVLFLNHYNPISILVTYKIHED